MPNRSRRRSFTSGFGVISFVTSGASKYMSFTTQLVARFHHAARQFSLAGASPTVGFYAKLSVLSAVLHVGYV